MICGVQQRPKITKGALMKHSLYIWRGSSLFFHEVWSLTAFRDIYQPEIFWIKGPAFPQCPFPRLSPSPPWFIALRPSTSENIVGSVKQNITGHHCPICFTLQDSGQDTTSFISLSLKQILTERLLQVFNFWADRFNVV